eukprot:1157302-Pelagomonas_calceolata.AAC.30
MSARLILPRGGVVEWRWGYLSTGKRRMPYHDAIVNGSKRWGFSKGTLPFWFAPFVGTLGTAILDVHCFL